MSKYVSEAMGIPRPCSLMALPIEIIQEIFRFAVYNTDDLVALATVNHFCLVTATQQFLRFFPIVFDIVESSKHYILPQSLYVRFARGSLRISENFWREKALLTPETREKVAEIINRARRLGRDRFLEQAKQWSTGHDYVNDGVPLLRPEAIYTAENITTSQIRWLPTHLWYPLDSFNQIIVQGSHGCPILWLQQIVDVNNLFLPELPIPILEMLQAHHGQLKGLDTSQSGTESLPASIGQFRALTFIDAMFNALETLPAELEQCTSLQNLSLHENSLRAVPDCVARLPKLEWIDLSHNQVTHFHEAVLSCHECLQGFDLGSNLISYLPNNIGEYSALQKLDLGNNSLTDLPPSIGQCHCLWELVVSHNFLTALPDTLGRCTALQHLDISANQIKNLPESLGQCTWLQRFTANENFLSALPESIGNWNKLHDLSMSSNNLKTLPPSIGQCQALGKLLLCENLLSELPDGIGICFELCALELDNNHLEHLPDSLCKLPKLRELHISENLLDDLPNAIGDLETLEQLDLAQNSMENLPRSIERCQRLYSIDIRGNLFTRIPNILQKLHGLSKVSVHSKDYQRKPTMSGYERSCTNKDGVITFSRFRPMVNQSGTTRTLL